jgi:hypothetical protein
LIQTTATAAAAAAVTAAMSGPLFKPFRALGYITEDVPFAVQRRGKETYITVSVGRTWQVCWLAQTPVTSQQTRTRACLQAVVHVFEHRGLVLTSLHEPAGLKLSVTGQLLSRLYQRLGQSGSGLRKQLIVLKTAEATFPKTVAAGASCLKQSHAPVAGSFDAHQQARLHLLLPPVVVFRYTTLPS